MSNNCAFCGEPTSEYAGNPQQWPITFTHPDGTGIAHTHCTKCVMDRVFRDEKPVEIWHGDRKISVYNDEVIRVWGTNIDDEMSSEARSHEAVDAAFKWLIEPPPRS